jgi:hypothetical protein
MALDHVDTLLSLPLPAILLALPHLQALFCDETPATRAVMVCVWQRIVRAVPPHIVRLTFHHVVGHPWLDPHVRVCCLCPGPVQNAARIHHRV